MDSYEKDKKKNYNKVDQGGKPTVHISTESITKDFGTVSQEIDQIISETIQPQSNQDINQSNNKQNLQAEYIEDNDGKSFEKNNQDNYIYQNSNHLIKEDDEKNGDEDLFEIKSDENKNNTTNFSEQTTPIKEDILNIGDKKHQKKFSIPRIKWNKKSKEQSKPFVDNKNTKCFSDDTKKKEGFFHKKQTDQINNKSIINESPPKKDVDFKNTNKSDKKSFNIFSKKKVIQKHSESITQKPFHESQDKEASEKTILQINNLDQFPTQQHESIDQEVIKLLAITDDLLGKLPEDVINEFASSEDFQLYKKVMNRYQIGK